MLDKKRFNKDGRPCSNVRQMPGKNSYFPWDVMLIVTEKFAVIRKIRGKFETKHWENLMSLSIWFRHIAKNRNEVKAKIGFAACQWFQYIDLFIYIIKNAAHISFYIRMIM